MNDKQALSDLAEAVIELDAKLVAVDVTLTALLDHVLTDDGDRIRLTANVANALIDLRKALVDGDHEILELITGATQNTLFKHALQETLERRIGALQSVIRGGHDKPS